MKRTTMSLDVADLFCGAGGFDAGLKLALLQLARERARLRFKPRLRAINHWDTAIASHAVNHPEAERVCADIYGVAPRDVIPDGTLDLLLASPTCTYYSRARGGKPISWDQRRGRMTPTQVLRWCRELEVKVLIVENVPEFEGRRSWGSCGRTDARTPRSERPTCTCAWPIGSTA